MLRNAVVDEALCKSPENELATCLCGRCVLTDKGVHAGGHYMTGPIYVCGAEPGDVIEVSLAHGNLWSLNYDFQVTLHQTVRTQQS